MASLDNPSADPRRPPADALFSYPDPCRAIEPELPQPAARRPEPWQIRGWDQPDLSYINPFVSARYRAWPLYTPQIELVPCGDRAKAALFMRVGTGEFGQWSQTVVARKWQWSWLETKDDPYVVLRLEVWFEDTSGGDIGLLGAGRATVTTVAAARQGYKLWCAAPFDPGNRAHRRAIRAWVTAPSPVMMFFVDENDGANAYVSLFQEHNHDALTQLDDARRQLSSLPAGRRGTFAQATTQLRLPAIARW